MSESLYQLLIKHKINLKWYPKVLYLSLYQDDTFTLTADTEVSVKLAGKTVEEAIQEGLSLLNVK